MEPQWGAAGVPLSSISAEEKEFMALFTAGASERSSISSDRYLTANMMQLAVPYFLVKREVALLMHL
jgi:hypothetical protein